MLKKILLFFMSLIIISFSFVMPNLLLGIEDLSREKEIFARQKIERKIDVEAGKIYLVTFIHDIYEIKDKKVYYEDKKGKASAIEFSTPIIDTRTDLAPTEKFKNEILKLVSNEILNEITFDEYIQYYEEECYFYPEYTVTTCSMPKENEEWISINVEEKTGKIISIDFSKNFLKTDIEREKQLRNYAKYLDLDIIGDWKFEKNNILKSEKAQLIIMLVERDDSCMLTIAPIEIYEEYVEEEEAIKREYKIVESNKKK